MTYPFNSRTRFTTWGLWILALIVADQVIKAAVEASMPLGASIAITAGFNWVHVNTLVRRFHSWRTPVDGRASFLQAWA